MIHKINVINVINVINFHIEDVGTYLIEQTNIFPDKEQLKHNLNLTKILLPIV